MYTQLLSMQQGPVRRRAYGPGTEAGGQGAGAEGAQDEEHSLCPRCAQGVPRVRPREEKALEQQRTETDQSTL